MATDDSRRKCQAATLGLLEEARARAQEFLRELASMSDTTQRQAQGAFDELIDGGRKSTELLLGFLSKEVSAQLAQLGFSPRVDLETLVRRFVGFPPGPMTWRRTGEPAGPAGGAGDERSRYEPTGDARARYEPAGDEPTTRTAPEEPPGGAGRDATSTTPGPMTAAAAKASGRKAVAPKKAAAKKAAAKKAPGEKAAGPRKAGAKKAGATSAAAKKTAGKSAGAKKNAGVKKTAGIDQGVPGD